jgi:hypothetical protein
LQTGRNRPIAVIQKSMSWTRSFAGIMIDHNLSGIDHGLRGLAANPLSRPMTPPEPVLSSVAAQFRRGSTGWTTGPPCRSLLK